MVADRSASLAWHTQKRARMTKAASTGDLSEEQHARLREVEVSLDQCWDLLRQRRAHREFGQNPDEATVRPAVVVEHYQQ